jgi:hypothetical protein
MLIHMRQHFFSVLIPSRVEKRSNIVAIVALQLSHSYSHTNERYAQTHETLPDHAFALPEPVPT